MKESPLFFAFATFLERLSKASGAQKKKLLDDFLEDAGAKGLPMFPMLRLLLPMLDLERPGYGMKENLLAKAYVAAMEISSESPHALALLNYRLPSYAEKSAGDFGGVLFNVLSARGNTKGGGLTVDAVNDLLDRLSSTSERGSSQEIIRQFQLKCSALENKWLSRIILKDMGLGVSEQTVFRSYHPDALELYGLCSNLRKVCLDLRDKSQRLRSQEISLFMPFKPMLASREPLQEIAAMMDGAFYIEPKLDGERMQIHKQGPIVRYWSRKGKEYTYLYDQSLTPFIVQSCFSSSVESVILDGEMIAYDPVKDRFEPFGGLKSAALDAHPTETSSRPCFVVFDMVFLNGRSLLSVPLSERIEMIRGAALPRKGHLLLSEQVLASSTSDLVSAVDKAIMKREEGIMVKAQHSRYQPGKRGSGWIKVKPEYIDSISDDLDLLIIGGFFSEGKRRGGLLNHFLLAIADDHEADKGPKSFYTFAKFGSGLTDSELTNLTRLLSPHWREVEGRRIPEGIHFAEAGERPDVWIPPEKSVIVQIKASEIVPAKNYAAGFSLRFPRLIKVRTDKAWSDCMTVSELDSLRKCAEGRLASKRLLASQFRSSKASRKPHTAGRKRGAHTVIPHFAPADLSGVQKTSDTFQGLEICVLNGGPSSDPKHLAKWQLEVMLASGGASVVQNPSSRCFCLIAGEINYRTSNLISEGTYDILTPSWVVDSLKASAVKELSSRYVLFATDRTKRKLKDRLDEFGDPFAEPTDNERLKEVLQGMTDEVLCKIPPAKRRKVVCGIEGRYLKAPSFARFRLRRFFLAPPAFCSLLCEASPSGPDVPRVPLHGSRLEILEGIITFQGGELSPTLDGGVTDLVLEDPLAQGSLQPALERLGISPRVVTYAEVLAEANHRSLLQAATER